MKKIISGELFFALFLFSGVFKESLNISIDLAAVFLILTFLAIIAKTYKEKSINRLIILPVSSAVLLYTILLISYMLFQNGFYATDKIVKFTLLTLPAIIIPLILFDSEKALHRFFKSLAMITLVLSLISLPSIFQRGAELSFIGFNNGNYQGLARLGGVGLIILVFYFLVEKAQMKYKVIYLLSTLVVAFVLLTNGSRMPLVAFLIATVYLLSRFVKFRQNTLYLRKGIQSLLVLVVLSLSTLPVIIKKGYFETTIYRFMVFFKEESGGSSAEGRLDRLTPAYKMIKESPFWGKGLGSFPLYFNGTDRPDYPHNLFIEVLAELGIIGIIGLLFYFFIGIVRTIKTDYTYKGAMPTLGIVTVGLFIYYLFNSQVSGDINSNRALYVFISIMCMFPIIFKANKA